MRELFPDPSDPTSIHIVGVGGAGMSALAKLLSQLGHTVTGSDLKPGRAVDALADVGVETWVGHRPEAMSAVDLVVASSAVPSGDPELTAAREAGVTVWRRPRLFGAITAFMPAIGFSGTHGKTTSTAMAAAALRACDLDPSFIVGGEMTALNTGAHLGSRELFVVEADEAFGTFRHMDFAGLGVTNIESDHLDHYGTVSALEEAFAQVASRVEGPVVGCIDDAGVRRLSQRTPVVGYGTSAQAVWQIVDLDTMPSRVSFTLRGPDGAHAVTVPRPGIHIARDAAGVLALLGEMGFDLNCAAAGLARFGGVRRRFEIRALVGGTTIVDDYAHHPTEVAATIEAARSGEVNRVWAIFQPHRYSRTADLAPDFGAPLALADRVVVTDVYPAGERPQPGVSGKLVAEAARAAGASVEYIPDLTDIPSRIAAQVEPGDVVLLLGAGDIFRISGLLATALGEEHAP
jgi:UDP-N-acetylmuramate--alanine ligase